MMATLYLGLYLLAGLWISANIFNVALPFRLLFGVVLGMILYAWLPALAAFFFGFTVRGHIAAIMALGLGMFFLRKRKTTQTSATDFLAEHQLFMLLVSIVFAFVATVLWHHTLTSENGALLTGQSTYGDMPMHLSFITSMAEQGTFPPEYSILPGTLLAYPFLCDSISSSMLVLGANLRWAYYLPMLILLACVFVGVYLLALEVSKKRSVALLTWIMVFFNGGLGFAYFLSGNFAEIFTEFYHTPTNFLAHNIRWVNLIADMLIPQRATLMGYAVLFTAVLALTKRKLIAAAVLIGALPMIHTHSFLAAIVIAGCWGVVDVWERKNVKNWLVFAAIVAVLALPQLIFWTFRQTSSGENFLKLDWNWANEGNNYFWFYIKNMGVFAIFIMPALVALWKKHWKFILPALVLWGLVETIQFTPNPYDNNKLLYIAYVLLAIVVCWFMEELYKRIQPAWVAKAVAVVVIFLMTFSALLTLGREAVSEYVVFEASEVALGEFVETNTPVDAVFLTAGHHNNAVAALAGRKIVCGADTFLYYHGVNYQAHQADAKKMMENPLENLDLLEKHKVDYIVVGPHERAQFKLNEQAFEQWGEVVYNEGNTKIYQTKM